MASEPLTYSPAGPFNVRIERDRTTDEVLLELQSGRSALVAFVMTTKQARELAANIKDVCTG